MVAELKDWDGHPLGPPIVVHCSAGNYPKMVAGKKMKRGNGKRLHENGVKCPKNAYFLVINSTNFRGGGVGDDRTAQYIPFQNY